ncbi:Transcriptional repressor MprA [Trichinella spiralis]|uniref:Transcriptional repressor MprA n=1 Tax=Trichinella spiralis TaxID=6334 RepID=A0ABR3KED7_TRISP
MEAISVNYPGPFICQKCRHSEAVFARFVTHCTHHALKWAIDHLREAKEVEDQLTASNSCSVKSFAEALSSKWSEAISIDMAKYLRKKLRRVDQNLNALNEGSKSRATRVGDEINGVGVLSTRDTSGFRVQIVGQTTPPPNKLRDALSPQHKGRDPGRDLLHHLEDSLTSCNKSALRQRLSQRPSVDAAPFTSKCPRNSKNILDTVFPDEVTLRLQKMKIHT